MDFKNMFSYNDKAMAVLGIFYLVECKKCGEVYLSNCRLSRKLTKKESISVVDKMKEGLEKCQ
jgi:hypothetical protein